MAIRLSGMTSGLDTEKIVESLVSAKSERKTKMEGEQTKLSWTQEAWKSLNSKIYAFYSKTVSNARLQSDYYKKSTSSTSDAVTIDSSSNAPVCVQTLKIKNMAKASYYTGKQLTKADGKKAEYKEDTKISELTGSKDSISIKSGSGETVEIEITDETTIGDVVKKMKEAGVAANFDEKQQRMYISSKDLGSENAFVLSGSSEVLHALGLNATPTDGSSDVGEYGTFIAASDATIVLNGQEYTSSNNTFEINGLTLTINKETSEDIVLNTKQDTSGIYDMVKNFFKEYNELINEMDKLYNAASANKYKMLTKEEKEEMSEDEVKEWEDKIKSALLRGDNTLGTVSSALKTLMLKGVQVGPEDNKTTMYLSEFGIATAGYFAAADNEKNAYHIDGDADDTVSAGKEDKLKAMIASDPDKVAEFFSNLAKNIYGKLGELMERSDYSSAFTVYNDKLMDKQYKDYSSNISAQEKKIATWEDHYYKKFTAMEKALTTLQGKESAIAGLFGMNQ